MSQVMRFGVSIESELLQAFDRLIADQGYANRSEAIRDLVRDRLVDRAWEGGAGEVVGTLTLVFNHHARELQERMTETQHDYHALMVSNLHVHLDAHNCLEVIVMRGAAEEIKRVADSLISQRGVVHGKLTATAPGEAL